MAQRVYVGGLPHDIGERELDDAFGRYGRLRNIWIARKPPGFGAQAERWEGERRGERARSLSFALVCSLPARSLPAAF